VIKKPHTPDQSFRQLVDYGVVDSGGGLIGRCGSGHKASKMSLFTLIVSDNCPANFAAPNFEGLFAQL